MLGLPRTLTQIVFSCIIGNLSHVRMENSYLAHGNTMSTSLPLGSNRINSSGTLMKNISLCITSGGHKKNVKENLSICPSTAYKEFLHFSKRTIDVHHAFHFLPDKVQSPKIIFFQHKNKLRIAKCSVSA